VTDFRERFDAGFGWWSRVVVRYRWVWIVLSLASAFGLSTRIPLMEIETSSEDYLFDEDPAKIAYNVFRDQYGRDQLIFVVVEPPEVFDLDFLAWLEALHRDIEDSVPHLDEVTSLVNVRSVYGQGDELFVDELLKDPPGSEAELEALRDRVLATPAYIDSMIGQTSL
jgi:predicted RND superfamily exporter protein